MSYTVGLLDQSPVVEGKTPYDALQETVLLASLAEQWGYHRFWVSEHHHSEEVVGSSPEVLIAYLVAKTNRIRIGSGGVMLQHYSPYKVAENFHILSTLAPGRIDVGIGKAPGGLPLSTRALQYDRVGEKSFEEQFAFLDELLGKKLDEDHAYPNLAATPIPSHQTENFLLGASVESATLAATKKWNFVFAQFFTNDAQILKNAAKAYRTYYPEGKFSVAVSVFAAPTQQEAEKLAQNESLYKVHLQGGKTVTVKTEEQATLFGKQAGVPFEVKEHTIQTIAGTPAFVHEQLRALQQQIGVDEFIFHTPVKEKQPRIRSIELLAPLTTSQKGGEQHAVNF